MEGHAVSAVTMQEAEAVREVVRTRFADHLQYGDPAIEDGEPWGYDWILAWEEGPFEWTIGFPRTELPSVIGISPVNHCVLGLYRERPR